MLLAAVRQMTSDGGVYCTVTRENIGGSVDSVREEGTNPVSI